jgi:hypothetical protein
MYGDQLVALEDEADRYFGLDHSSIAIAWSDAEGDACDACPASAGPNTDSDGDGIPDPCVRCPSAADADGVNGDRDGDSIPDACDNCPAFYNGGQLDADADGVGNACDPCAWDPEKIELGTCGCGTPDTDTDADGSICGDRCPYDGTKVDPGLCGCGQVDDDTDSDGDSQPDCVDACPLDPAKILPYQCGCGAVETDSDGDGAADCVDFCPADSRKRRPGRCGCGTPDYDTDGDYTPDCLDECPENGSQTVAGPCGCGVPETDLDGDGTLDCLDGCPTNPALSAPGVCGCDLAPNPTDSDADTVPDCLDNCPNTPNADQANSDAPWAGSIPFAPEPAGAQALTLGDDEVSPPIPIGFPFSFFGKPVYLMYVYDNGLIGLANPAGSGCCEGTPLPAEDETNGIIAVAWSDLIAPFGRVSYEVRGTAPARRMVVTWENVPTCCSQTNPAVTAQAILYEQGSRIEIHTTTQPGEQLFTRGVENFDGSAAAYLPGEAASDAGVTASGAAYLTADVPVDLCDACPLTIPCPE